MNCLMKTELGKQYGGWVNSPDAVSRAHFKPLQLKCASDCGMSIPTTLCSSDANDIQAFLKTYSQYGVVYQPLHGDAGDSIVLTPGASWPSGLGIFQKKIIAQYAIRVTCFGASLVAEKMASNMPIMFEPYLLPRQLGASIRACMAQLGLLSAVFAFTKTPDDTCVFMNLTAFS